MAGGASFFQSVPSKFERGNTGVQVDYWRVAGSGGINMCLKGREAKPATMWEG